MALRDPCAKGLIISILAPMDPTSLVTYQADQDLVTRISQRYGLDKNVCERIVEEVLHEYGSTMEEWVRSRHIRLQRQGLKNPVIYSMIHRELRSRRFMAPPLSLRQIRRMIYG